MNVTGKRRRSLLFVPGSSPRFLEKAAGTEADSLILDLEDAVSPGEKADARERVRAAIPALRETGREILVRVNALDGMEGIEDLLALAPQRPDGLVIPKATARVLLLADGLLGPLEGRLGLAPGSIALIPLVETAAGLLDIAGLLRTAERIDGVLLGGEDLARDMELTRTREGAELLHARSVVALAARAVGIAALDTPFPAVEDMEGLTLDAGAARSLGFTGKACIHPAQVSPVNACFSPGEEEIRLARRTLSAYEAALREGRGACLFEGRMLDAPVAERARRLLARAEGHPD